MMPPRFPWRAVLLGAAVLLLCFLVFPAARRLHDRAFDVAFSHPSTDTGSVVRLCVMQVRC